MGMTSYIQASFLGGEVSQSFQGRIDRTDYRTFLNVCLNTIPVETGAALRRPGTRLAALTRGAAPARLIAFAFEQNFPYNMLFSDGWLRFVAGFDLVKTNDKQTIASILAANPAVVATTLPHGWSTGNTAMLDPLVGAAPLQNRQVTITVLTPLTFSIADAITGTTIDGATLGTFVSGNVARVLEIATPYTAQSWKTLRAVQAEKRAVLLNGTRPQVLEVALSPTEVQYATFTLTPSDFLDGPYLDPIPGSYVTSNAPSGVVTLTFSFQPYDAARAYNIGDYVSSGGVHYRSIAANNVGHAPPNATYWLAVNGGDPINDGAGFSEADIGRLIRLFSEPPLYNPANTYASPNVVAYETGDGGTQYWKAIGAVSAGEQPGTSTDWVVLTPGATWSWGRILSVSGSGIAAPDSAFGTMTGGGGVNAVKDGTNSKAFAASATATDSTVTYPAWFAVFAIGAEVQYANTVYRKLKSAIDAYGDPIYELIPPPVANLMWLNIGITTANLTISRLVGEHFAAGKIVQSATIYPTNDKGFTTGNLFTLNLRGKSTAPSTPSDGTLLASTGSIANTLSPITLNSSDQTSSWNYIWVEQTSTHLQPLPDDGSHVYNGFIGISQIVVFQPNIANGSVITVQIVGPALLNGTETVRKWRLGVYGGANGWPLCGTFHENRLWLSGVVKNRVDASKSLPSTGPRNVFDFAPTAPSGVVADDNGITAVATGKGVNHVLWMEPDDEGIICGTPAGEYFVSPAAPGALSPTNLTFKARTRIGCANIEPRRTEHTLAFVQRFQRKIMEYFGDVHAGKFSAPNLAEKAKHMTVRGIQEIAYQQELAPILWARVGSGALVGATYKRESLMSAQGPTFIAWHRHTFGSGFSIDSICVGPSAGGNLDSLSLVTADPATGYRYVEVMTNLLDEGFALPSCWFVDCGIAPTGITANAPTVGVPYGSLTINGLWPHNGKTVSAFVAGLDCGDFLVTNGAITVPFGDSVSGGTASGLFTLAYLQGLSSTLDLTAIPIAVGFTYTSDGQIVRTAQQAESGTQAGTGQGKERRADRFTAQLYGVINGTISFGVDFASLKPIIITNKRGDTPYTVLQPWSGIYRGQLAAPYDFDNMLCWRVTRPVPAFVIALGGRVVTQD